MNKIKMIAVDDDCQRIVVEAVSVKRYYEYLTFTYDKSGIMTMCVAHDTRTNLKLEKQLARFCNNLGLFPAESVELLNLCKRLLQSQIDTTLINDVLDLAIIKADKIIYARGICSYHFDLYKNAKALHKDTPFYSILIAQKSMKEFVKSLSKLLNVDSE